MIRKSILAGLILCVSYLAIAQQTASLAQYMFNPLAINPAFAGANNLLSASFISRFQNIGLEGAPNTQTLSIHSPLWQKNISGGALIIRDKIGIINNTGVHAAGAYRIFFDNDGEHSLSFGMQYGLINYNANYTKLKSLNPDDPYFNTDINQTRMNIGAGAFYMNKLFFLGVSMPHMMNNVFDGQEDFATVFQSVPMLFHGGYIHVANPSIRIKPNFLVKVTDGRISDLDINCNVQLEELLWVGLSYRFPGINFLSEIKLSDQLLLGYAYGIGNSSLRGVGISTHELLLNFRFKFTKYKLTSPRYF
ncbi:PorP/SprF family type IX secretion system membrane protein [Ekhidna sp.]|uniref:PorP/SprF family type IX secretion system membrane protein n=1 Tax=Ekhidna sp. TaxID=2608089 RepID=UPI003CCBA72E